LEEIILVDLLFRMNFTYIKKKTKALIPRKIVQISIDIRMLEISKNQMPICGAIKATKDKRTL